MSYERLTNSKFIKDKINTCEVFVNCSLCPYYENNKFPRKDYVGGCKGYTRPYNHVVAMERADYYNRLAELEDKLESGELLKLPCKMGDPVWVVYSPEYGEYDIYEAKAIGFEIGNTGIRIITNFCCYESYRIGNYTTKEAAEARLKELQEGKK